MHIALFGGAFDPPHNGHIRVARGVLSVTDVDEIWFVPVYIHPWAKKLAKEFLTPYKQRKEMLEIALNVSNVSRMKIAEFKDVSYTYDTLKYFSDQFPEHTFSWVMGSEYLPKFSAFLEIHPRLTEYTFFIYPRAEHALEPLYDNMIALDEMPEVVVSSSMVRERVNLKQNISDLASFEVREYIERKSLYVK